MADFLTRSNTGKTHFSIFVIQIYFTFFSMFSLVKLQWDMVKIALGPLSGIAKIKSYYWVNAYIFLYLAILEKSLT